MKYLKVLSLCLLSFLLAGCDVNYNLEISNNYMTESVDFWYDDTSENKTTVNQYLDIDHQAYFDMDLGQGYNYAQKKITKKNKIGMNLTYNYRSDDLQKSSLLNKCYYKKSVTKADDEISISTDGKLTCFYADDNKLIDKLNINIKTDLNVLKHNADKVSGNTYTWVIDESNYTNHPIQIRISTKAEKEKNYDYLFLIILAGIIVMAILIILSSIYIKNKKNNKI